MAARPQVVLHPDGGHDLRRRAAQRGAQARGLGQPQQRRRHHRRDPLPEARPRPRAQGHARRAVELLHEEPAAARSTTTSRSTASRRSSAARTTRRSSAPRRPPRRRSGDWPAPRPRWPPPPGDRRGERRLEAPHRRGGATPARSSSASGSSATASTAVAPARCRPAVTRPVLGPPRPGVVPRCGREATLVERELRARPRAAARRPAGSRGWRCAPTARYGRYLVELMRLPSLPPTRSPASSPSSRPTGRSPIREAVPRGGGLIFDRRAHRQQRGGRRGDRPTRASRSASWPTTRRSPSCSSTCARQREAGGSRSSRGATCGRSTACSGAAEMLGLLIDWGYRERRHPGPAVRRLDDAAGRPGRRSPPGPGRASSRSPSTASRTAGSTSHGRGAIDVASGDPAELQRATQPWPTRSPRDPRGARRSGTASSRSGRTIAAEAADLERRARLMQAGRPDPGPDRALATPDDVAATDGAAAAGDAAP